MHSTSGRHTGLLYLAPALVFVAVFTAFPVIQMLWMSLHNWSLIEPPKWVGFANYVKAYKDSQFWTSLRFTLTYPLYITPILMIGGFLIALLVAQNSHTRLAALAVLDESVGQVLVERRLPIAGCHQLSIFCKRNDKLKRRRHVLSSIARVYVIFRRS